MFEEYKKRARELSNSLSEIYGKEMGYLGSHNLLLQKILGNKDSLTPKCLEILLSLEKELENNISSLSFLRKDLEAQSREIHKAWRKALDDYKVKT